MGISFRDILLIIISKGTNNCVQHVFEKKHVFHNVIIRHFQLSYFNERLDFCDKTSKRSKGLIMQVYFQSLLWSYLSRVPIILTMTVYNVISINKVISLSLLLSHIHNHQHVEGSMMMCYCNESLLALESICSLFIKQEKFQSQHRAKPEL